MNTRARVGTLGCALVLVLASLSDLLAHHSAAATYDADHTLRIAGTVAGFAWKNPHCHVYIGVSGGAFDGQQYTVELSSAEMLANSGWTKTSLRPGDRVVMDVHPSRVGAAIGLCRNCPMTLNGRVRSRVFEEG